MLPLPVTFDLPLPRLSRLPAATLLAGSMGYVYGQLTDSPALLCGKIFAIIHLANSIFFLLADAWLVHCNQYLDNDDSMKRFVFVGTTVISQVIGIIAMSRFNLIATKGIVLWSLFTLGMGIRQIIQSLDRFEDLRCIPLENVVGIKSKER